jgi:hypothetical protein
MFGAGLVFQSWQHDVFKGFSIGLRPRRGRRSSGP